MFRRCSNSGKWGADDELGTLNYVTAAKRIAAAQLVRTGEVVSIGRDISKTASKVDPHPVHLMVTYGNGPGISDYFTMAPHGMTITHLDALSHFSFDDTLYNGRKRSATMTAGGARWGSIYAMRHGIFTRGVLARCRRRARRALVRVERIRDRRRLRGGREAAERARRRPATRS